MNKRPRGIELEEFYCVNCGVLKLKTAIVVSIALLLGYIYWAKWGGICIEQGRYLSDEFFISLTKRMLFDPRGGPSSNIAKEVFRANYSNQREFEERNPNCCVVSRKSDWFSHLITVTMTYPIQYIGKSAIYSTYAEFFPCGEREYYGTSLNGGFAGGLEAEREWAKAVALESRQ